MGIPAREDSNGILISQTSSSTKQKHQIEKHKWLTDFRTKSFVCGVEYTVRAPRTTFFFF